MITTFIQPGDITRYQLIRMAGYREKYWWGPNDSTMRPIPYEIEELLQYSGGQLGVNLDDLSLIIDINRRVVYDVNKGTILKFATHDV